jgi:hypothetical protein
MPAIEPLWKDRDGNPLMIRDVVHPDNASEAMLMEVVGFEVLPIEDATSPCTWSSAFGRAATWPAGSRCSTSCSLGVSPRSKLAPCYASRSPRRHSPCAEGCLRCQATAESLSRAGSPSVQALE